LRGLGRWEFLWVFAGLDGLAVLGCERALEGEPAPRSNAASEVTVAPAAATVRAAQEPSSIVSGEPPGCGAGMSAIPGGTFWVGRATPTFEEEENPRFSTRLPPFCAQTHEVTAAAYEACVAKEACTPIGLSNFTCNTVAKGRGDHPANCVDHSQASAFCRATGARLPTEIEWEYLARGGAEMRPYPWGDAGPDDHACWKANQTCKVGSYPAGAFGLFDVVGNVWEWTDSWFGAYPWPNVDGRHRVYRGGSWSRRFEKWMQPTLRNRSRATEAGSHLGFRCVQELPGAECPYGRGEAGCKFGLEAVQCLGDKTWNGVRCAAPSDEVRCPGSSREVEGRGCQWDNATPLVASELDLTVVRRTRSPRFDADCLENQASRPHAYRLDGGEHLARNQVARERGCKNRDVGVGWNSVCCPGGAQP
jgi:sulfatase modifying factor 1